MGSASADPKQTSENLADKEHELSSSSSESDDWAMALQQAKSLQRRTRPVPNQLQGKTEYKSKRTFGEIQLHGSTSSSSSTSLNSAEVGMKVHKRLSGRRSTSEGSWSSLFGAMKSGNSKRISKELHNEKLHNTNNGAYGGLSFSAQNLTLSSEGAEICHVTSRDHRFPASNVLDGDPRTFWLSTGLFPQEIMIVLPSVSTIECIKICTANVRMLTLEISETMKATDFKEIFEVKLDRLPPGRKRQRYVSSSISTKKLNAQYLRFRFHSGWKSFVAMYSVEAEGAPIEQIVSLS
mmetsp:Transcript_29004/g.40426  ORF Transcript_29004/g.40426 Transcript_29004/m.40426 type:complete len:294 (+) Transcript_29004:161-1042(+)